jgi:hypothetical protein
MIKRWHDGIMTWEVVDYKKKKAAFGGHGLTIKTLFNGICKTCPVRRPVEFRGRFASNACECCMA